MEFPIKGGIVQVDARDAHLLVATSWHVDKKGYAHSFVDGKNVRLHQLIGDAKSGQMVDHRSRDKLDCRRRNLRPATTQQNCSNTGKRAHNTSGFKGVYFCRFTGRWRAEIRHDKKCVKIGRYDLPADAARAYDAKALELHGEFAVTNQQLGLL